LPDEFLREPGRQIGPSPVMSQFREFRSLRHAILPYQSLKDQRTGVANWENQPKRKMMVSLPLVIATECCPRDPEAASDAYCLGRMRANESKLFEQHCTGCPDCSALVTATEMLIEALKTHSSWFSLC
jgi:hypothetical protein